MNVAPIDYLRSLPRDERLAFLRSLPPGALAAADRTHAWNARPEQALPEPGDLARIELAIGGLGAGKTWWAIQLFMREYLAGRARLPALTAATLADAVRTLIKPPSGIWAWLPYEWRAKLEHEVDNAITITRDGGTFQLPGLPEVQLLSVIKPGRATGQGKDLTLFDDPAKCVKVCGERRTRDMFRELRVSTREGRRPCIIMPTTLDGMGFLRRALSGNMAGVRKRNLRTAKDNTALSPEYKADVIDDLLLDGATADLTGVETLDTPGALWKWSWITHHRVVGAPDLMRIVVAVDPADDGKQDSDETGIVVVGLGHDGRLYVLADYTALHDATAWPAICAWAVTTWKADGIVAEVNRARSLVRRCLSVEAPNVAIHEVDATRGKATRAEPIAMYYRDGHVSHVIGGPQLDTSDAVELKVLWYDPTKGKRVPREITVARQRNRWQTLEDELCNWVPSQSRSPNGLDALVWAATHLRPPDGSGGEDDELLALPGRYVDAAPAAAPPAFAGAWGRRGRR